MPKIKFFGAALAVLASVGLEGVAFSQAKISTTGRVYSPSLQAETVAQPKSEPEASQLTESEPGEAETHLEPSPQEPQTDTDRLNLVCIGGGSANKADVATAYGSNSGTAFGSNGNWATYSGTSNATIVGTRSQGFADQVRVRLDDNDPRLRMPRSMLPAIRGGKDGWFKLKDVKYGEGEITASVAVNMFNNPKLRLDRYTGAISISGKAGDFTGQCQKFDPQNVERAF